MIMAENRCNFIGTRAVIIRKPTPYINGVGFAGKYK